MTDCYENSMDLHELVWNERDWTVTNGGKSVVSKAKE